LANVETTAPIGGGSGERCYPLTTYLKNGNVIKCKINGNCTSEKDLVKSGSDQACAYLTF